jgi:alkylhydroperoxidase family enzyme
MLHQLGVDAENIKDVISDEKSMLKDDERAAVQYAEAVVTRNAVEVPEEVYQEMKKYYNDAQLVEITAAIGLFNYINRFNDALGVLPEGV